MFVGIFQLFLVYKQFKEQNKWQKKNATMEYLKTYPNLLKYSANTKELNLFEKEFPTLTYTELKEKLEKEPQIKTDLMSVAGYFEYLALGIINDYFDEYTAQEYFHLIAMRVYDSLNDYFIIREEQTGRPVCNNFKTLYKSWKATKYLSTGKKFKISRTHKKTSETPSSKHIKVKQKKKSMI